MPVLNPKALVEDRVQAIRDFHAKCGVKRATLDVSGGIDSAVMASLLVLALGPENVTFDHTIINSNPVQTDRAKRLIAAIGGKLAVGHFNGAYNAIMAEIKMSLHEAGFDMAEIQARMEADPTIEGSIRSTLRAPLGRAFNRMTGGGIRHGTGNECEDRYLRFFQKGGDGEVDCNAIEMLSKAEVYQLAYELATGGYFPITGTGHGDQMVEPRDAFREVMFETIGCIPSADLWACGDQHNDEDEISKWLGAKFTYGKLDTRTGKVVSIGTIERVARFLDNNPTGEDLFNETLADWVIDRIFAGAKEHPSFVGVARDTIEALLRGARKAERQTRHKWNPNCPMLSADDTKPREALLKAGILSDNLADYGI